MIVRIFYPQKLRFNVSQWDNYVGFVNIPNIEGYTKTEEFNIFVKKYINEKKTDLGEDLEYVCLITPGRKSAIDIYQEARYIGVQKILYADNNGNFWNPFPAGNWIKL